MPTINIDKELLFTALGRTFTTEEFEDLCFDFGIELEEETSELEMATKEVGAEKAKGFSNRGIYRIDIPANRIDLLCMEGLSRSLSVYLGNEKPPVFTLSAPAQRVQIHVKGDVDSVRPYIIGAVLRDIDFNEHNYASFIELQEKLHNNICRKRTLVAIGTHDLDTISGPFTYTAMEPTKISFVPLNQTQVMNGEQLMKFYETDRRMSKFLPIIRDKPKFPVVLDGNGVVCSLPPIINGDHSKIKLTTRNVLIECTATDITKANVVLNTIVTMFSQYCSSKFTVEPVEVIQIDGKMKTYPTLEYRKFSTNVDYINKSIGINLNSAEITTLLGKMSLDAKVLDNGVLDVIVPPTRSDVLHACDIMEDVAISYNFNKIPETTPKANTVASPFPINKLSDQLRIETAFSGFTEVLPLILCSHDENYAYLNKSPEQEPAVHLANPKTVEYQVVRTSLLPGVLKTVQSNKRMPLPLKIFEVSDVVFKDMQADRKARNQRNFCALYCNKVAGFEVIHGLLDRLMKMMNVKNVNVGESTGYYIKESDSMFSLISSKLVDETFFEGRRADIYYLGKKVGVFGILHPDVLARFEVNHPCSALEFNVEPFL